MTYLDKLGIIIGLCAFSVFCFEINVPENCTHSATSQGCWGNGFNILREYHDTSDIPSGKLVEVNTIYTLILMLSHVAKPPPSTTLLFPKAQSLQMGTNAQAS